MADKIRLNLDLPAAVVEDVRVLAQARSSNMTEAIRFSINLATTLNQEKERGAKLIIERNGIQTEVLFV
ncbi:hypothetical protein [Caballeronia sp. LZ034LL]|uniref:hypothetical protein n=1 Tax=Caballeronia sp. LZ034LL TaxID=3038567 RepID=UPI00286333A4|nr:hypothetical protein [Caballeronia sp. LZ034LL]MDR5839291.1 hypothetical protein [Caballeronia sp. LZ034LL]